MVPIIQKIDADPLLEYSIIAADMHMASLFGKTIQDVKDFSDRVYTVETLMHSDSRLSRAKSIGICILGVSELLSQIRPDLFFILGDRGEVLGAAICAMEMNIPIVHIFGGDVTQGGVDEPVRHALTKIANIHLASNQDSADRIIQMGEEPWRVHNVGSPVLDLINQRCFSNPGEVAEKFKLDLKKPIVLLLQHSVTWQVDDAEHQIKETLKALVPLGYQTVAVYPCADPGYSVIIRELENMTKHAWFQVYPNLDYRDFWGLMNISSAFVGNSSAGVLESASFKIPFINIGIRQEGRLRAENVIDVDHESQKIRESIELAIHDEPFRKRVENCVSPFGDGYASDRIVSILKGLELNDKILSKQITY